MGQLRRSTECICIYIPNALLVGGGAFSLKNKLLKSENGRRRKLIFLAFLDLLSSQIATPPPALLPVSLCTCSVCSLHRIFPGVLPPSLNVVFLQEERSRTPGHLFDSAAELPVGCIYVQRRIKFAQHHSLGEACCIAHKQAPGV